MHRPWTERPVEPTPPSDRPPAPGSARGRNRPERPQWLAFAAPLLIMVIVALLIVL